MNKRFSLLLSTAALLTVSMGSSAMAQEVLGGTISGNVGIVSDYVFRGMTQSDENPALQGGVDYTHESGAYIGVWGSSIDFNDSDEASLEMDLYAGYNGEIEGFSYGLGGIFYYYPGANNDLNYDFWELNASLGYDFDVASVGASFNYSPDFFGKTGDAYYVNGSVSVPLPYEFSFNTSAGYQWIDDEVAFGTSDYADWSVGLGYAWEGFDFSASYVDTDIAKSECDDNCDARFILGVSKSF